MKNDPDALIPVRFLRGANPGGIAMGPGLVNQKGMPVGTAKIKHKDFLSLYASGKVVPLEEHLPAEGEEKGVKQAGGNEGPLDDPRARKR